jgi:RHS repeat-associated protein
VAPATTVYQYDRAGHLIEDSDVSTGSAHPQSDYLYLEGKPIGLYKPGTGLFFYHNDRLGTPQLVTNNTKGVFWRGTYQPFGPVTITASLTQNLRLPGQYADAETGWSHNGARTYAQGLGRYLETDPIGLKGGLNTYAYADGNPLKRFDPRGLAGDNPLTPNDMFGPNGTLSNKVLENPIEIIPPEGIKNMSIPSGFWKYTTQTYCTPSGTYETHYYYNSSTQEVYYGQDYKTVPSGSGPNPLKPTPAPVAPPETVPLETSPTISEPIIIEEPPIIIL